MSYSRQRRPGCRTLRSAVCRCIRRMQNERGSVEGLRALDSGIATQIEVREYRAEDADAALALRNQVFPPIGPQHWAKSQTAAIALLDGRLVGVVPFTIRTFALAPSVAIRAAFANSVAVAEDLRGMGIGTRMMDSARLFLAARAEAMCVYTSHEA